MLRTRLKPEEGWASFLLLMLMLLSVVWSVRAAEWTDGLAILQWIAIGAVWLGLLLAQTRRIPGIVAHLVSVVIGTAWVTLMLLTVFSPPVVPPYLVPPGQSLVTRVHVMYQQVQRWLLDPSGAEVWLSNFMFVVTLAALSWLLSYFSTWFVLRSHWVWGAIVPAGLACLLNIYYGPPRLVIYFVLYCLFSLLLLVRMHVYLRQKIWRKAAVNYNLDVDLTFLRDGFLISMLALFLAWSIPAVARSPKLADFWAKFEGPWHEVQTRWNRLFTSLNYQGPSTLVRFGRTMSLGGAVNLSNTPILEVQADEPHYWRAVAYDRYTGSGWVNTDDLEWTLQPNDPRLAAAAPYLLMQKEITCTIRMLESGEDILFFTGQLLRVNQFAKARAAYLSPPEIVMSTEISTKSSTSIGGTPMPVIRLSPAQTKEEVLVSMLQALKPLRRNQSYTVVSLVSTATVSQLRAAGKDYPEWMKERYLQLPRNLPERVRLLSQEIVEGALTPYDQAVAIQNYLRDITYDQFINPPPAGRDVVDWFLFENRRGYCDYYATAMAVMCRAVGIPARVSQGYTSGEYIAASRSYRVRQLDAHAWPEVYFPGYGWIEFEPTSSEPLIARLEDSATPALPGLDLLAEGQQETAEEKFGRDELLAEGEGQADITLTQSKSWQSRLLYGVLALMGIFAGGLLLVIGWWFYSLRGLSTAASVYEQMQRLGGLLGVAHRMHQTPAEYGESLASVIPESRDAIRYVIFCYVKQRFGKTGLDKMEEKQLREQWLKLRALIWRRLLIPRWPQHQPRTTVWVSPSSLRPPTSLG
ncbi:MAG: transglutaminase domain-containing protein [Chloroflexi bacterium]|nr:transglutaminase domain-containing protein [Chloroflexota bacterium]